MCHLNHPIHRKTRVPQAFSVGHQTQFEIANQSFRSHVSRQKALESLIGPLGQEIAALQQEISTLEKNNSASAISPETLQELTPSRLASVAKSHYIDAFIQSATAKGRIYA